ncbi:uncharacterized protein LOC120254125 [Dioscorea cayenensis subsp. rotundata]|uniref:Uncharacterized protein LOC120254125 n=1 Tax=Dioscorea cayennensis subsp. rotundata TaxID=55577 RepID=A0AB40AV93_DIOCR|nr:uncharacterized protein LOC120254125 [Dioscorea cayenensis subsp. rotundata]
MVLRLNQMAKAKSVKKLKDAIQALQKSMSFSWGGSVAQPDECMPEDGIVVVPKDVKEGTLPCWQCMARGHPKRYVVSHWFLLRLLEMASEESGFSQAGGLALSCRPRELERIISDL